MASTARPFGDERQGASGRWVLVLCLGLGVVAIGARVAAGSGVAWLQAFLLAFGSLLLAAIPFVAIGAVAASIVAVFVPFSFIERIGQLPRALQLPVAGLAGIGFPICECGSVPLARRLMLRGVSPAAAMTFMLAAPVVNPVVIGSTFVAYRGRGSLVMMVGGRFLFGLLVAIVVGWVAGRGPLTDILRRQADQITEQVIVGRPESRWRTFFVHVGGDFSFMVRYLMLGAFVAASVQTFLPQRVIGNLASVPIVDTLAMMSLAAILSLCSESDAFIAASFGQMGFGPSTQLAFLVFGPMFDMKLGAMYAGTFRRPVLKAIIVSSAIGTLVLTTWIRVVSG
jgi:uncharacterized membrane protein YraQ (UPF0718 family)